MEAGAQPLPLPILFRSGTRKNAEVLPPSLLKKVPSLARARSIGLE